MKSIFLTAASSIIIFLLLCFFLASPSQGVRNQKPPNTTLLPPASRHLLDGRNSGVVVRVDSTPNKSSGSHPANVASPQVVTSAQGAQPSRPTVKETLSPVDKRPPLIETRQFVLEDAPTHNSNVAQQQFLVAPAFSGEVRFIEVPVGESVPLVLSEVLPEDDFTPSELAKNAALADEFLKSATQTDAASQPVRWRSLVNQADELFRTWYGTDAFLAMEARRHQELSKDQGSINP